MQKPFAQSYWVREALFCAGHYPGSPTEEERDEKLSGLVRCGIRRVINLIPSHETAGGTPFAPYEDALQTLAAAQGRAVECLRFGYADGSTPMRSHMTQILDVIDASLASQEPLYLHCWGGHGRTGTTVACYLIRNGHSAQDAIDQILAWRATLPRNHYPFEGRQEAFVRSWQRGE